MSNPYSSQAISGYNATPPSDDGSQTAANTVKWATHKDKLADPIKTLAEAINTQTTTAFGKIFGNSVSSKTTAFTVATSDQGKLFAITGTTTATLLAAATASTNFTVAMMNIGTAVVTVDGDGSETINVGQGDVTSITLGVGQSVILISTGSKWYGMLTGNVLPRGYIDGLILSNDSGDTVNDINITAGSCRDSSDNVDIVLAAEITKKIDVDWVVADDQGGFPSALTLTNDTWYHVFVVKKTDGTVDAGFDTSLTAANLLTDMGATYVEYRRIGSVLYGTATIVQFIQAGDWTLWSVPGQDFSDSVGTTPETKTLGFVPPDVRVVADLALSVAKPAVANNSGVATSPDQGTIASAPGGAVIAGGILNPAPATAITFAGRALVVTNTSAQVVVVAGQVTSTLTVSVQGYQDFRGKDGE